ncbi:MAG: 30S ribosomal protein S12 methylthiotransferase accessory factor YcaO [Burkholderiales bacterium]|nr:30S ribosomal protein S12 methylthiotransferase accessory factor YcaO [Burkholderiales bacterium]
MHSESFIVGKDAALESSIATMQTRLEALDFHVEERSWLNPVNGIWSVHVRERDCPLLFTNGKGGSREAALASALGEFFERLSTNYFWNHYYLGYAFAEGRKRAFVHYPQEQWFALDEQDEWPQALLTPELQAFYNPQGSIAAQALVDFNSGNAERGICTIPYVRQRDQAQVLFPVNIIGNLYVSNGMSAGNSVPEARAQALSEIFERHVKFRILREGLCLPDVPEEVINRYPRIAAGIAGLRAAGFGIVVKDASLGGQFPVMNVTLLNPHDQGCFSSFGAHPRLEVALERSLTELLQGRALDALGGFPPPGLDLDEVASAPNLEIHFVDSSGIVSWNFLGAKSDFAFCDWNFSTSTAQDYAWLQDAVHALGHDVYVADFTHLGVYACRIIVPGMSEIYPLEDLEWENNSVANPLREPICHLSDLDEQERCDLLDALNESGLADERLVAALIGLAAGDNPFWSDLRVGELKALLALSVGDDEAIEEGCAWVRQFAQINPARLRVYACIEHLRGLGDPEPFQGALEALYGAATLQQASAMLQGESVFFDQPTLGLDLAHFPMHQRLLEAYGKLRYAVAASAGGNS